MSIFGQEDFQSVIDEDILGNIAVHLVVFDNQYFPALKVEFVHRRRHNRRFLVVQLEADIKNNFCSLVFFAERLNASTHHLNDALGNRHAKARSLDSADR